MSDTCDCSDCKQDRLTARHVAEALSGKRDLLACLPPVARGDRVSVPRETYERARAAIAEAAAAEERGRDEVLRAHDGRWSDERVRVEIAEAEERGRRRGVEEAAKIVEEYGAPIVNVSSVTARIRALSARDPRKEG